MHESSIARSILKAALAEGERNRAHRLLRVSGWVAETETLSLESLKLLFAAHARGTQAEGATLDLRVVHVEARCASCQTVYLPEHHLLICPACGGTEGEVIGQTGLGIDSVEVEQRA